MAVATRTPYGRGEETVVDAEVRRTWQIDADRLHLGGRHWQQTLDAIVAQAAAGLGVAEPVSAELYKLLIYDTGSFFVEHRDTEKAASMFATLVIVLPSDCLGGTLLLRHHDREVCLDLHAPYPAEVAFAAFYADCVHEMRPVTQGYRLTLVYNLLLAGKGKKEAIKPPSYEKELAEVTALLQRWVAGRNLPDDDAPEKLIYPLEHAYTSAALAFDSLKNADAAVAAVLVAAAAQADCDIHVALICIDESGSAEYSGYGGGGCDDEFEVVDVCDREQTVSDWRLPDGSEPGLNAVPFEDDELCPPGALEDAQPDEEHFHEASGYEGVSFERSYRRAAIVLWPKSRKLAVINQAGPGVTLPYLAELTRDWLASGSGAESALWRDAHTLSTYMLQDWQMHSRYGAMESEARMLTCLHQLRDSAQIDAFLSAISGAGCYGGSENEALVRAAMLLPQHRATDLIEKIVVRNAHHAPGGCANLLARCCADMPDSLARLYPAATALVETLLGERGATDSDPSYIWRQAVPVDAALLVDLLPALNKLDATALGMRLVEHALSSPKSFPMDAVLVPAAMRLTEWMQALEWAPVTRLHAACVNHLQTRCAQPLAPPSDFTRPSTIACRCASCAELSRFLAAPDRRVWEFKAIEPLRQRKKDIEALGRLGVPV
nr:2OG-Fe(II) oxygenase [uncultured Noviherbaspirillum sp.]